MNFFKFFFRNNILKYYVIIDDDKTVIDYSLVFFLINCNCLSNEIFLK